MSAIEVELTSEQYHADRVRISRSQLVDYLESPWQCYQRHVLRDPTWQREVTEDLRFGIRFHEIVLEGKRYEDTVKLIPNGVLNDAGERKGGAFTEWKKATPDHESYLRPKDVIAERMQVQMMLQSIQRNPDAVELLYGSEGKNEMSIHWDVNGCDLRTRLDRVIPGRCIVDLKTARSCDLDKINNSIEYDNYYKQSGFYSWAYQELTGDFLPWKWIFVEKTIPFRTVVVDMCPQWTRDGRYEMASAITRYQRSCETGDWQDPSSQEAIFMRRPKSAEWKWHLREQESE